MIHAHRPKDDPARRSRLLSRILDPEYSGSATPPIGSLGLRSPSLPQPSVFVDRYGQAHDPDFRPFGSHPVVTPATEIPAWPWDEEITPTSPAISHSTGSSSFHSRSSLSSGSGTRSRSVSVLHTPPLEPEPPSEDGRRHMSPPGHIPRASLFPWTPAQRAVRIPHEVNKRNIPPPPPFIEEEEREDIPLTLVDSRYVPGYGHFAAPPAQVRAMTSPGPEAPKEKKKGRARAHTVPVSATDVPPVEEDQPPSPSCSSSFRQSVYSFGLKTKLGLYHFKTRMREASGAAKRPMSL